MLEIVVANVLIVGVVLAAAFFCNLFLCGGFVAKVVGLGGVLGLLNLMAFAVANRAAVLNALTTTIAGVFR